MEEQPRPDVWKVPSQFAVVYKQGENLFPLKLTWDSKFHPTDEMKQLLETEYQTELKDLVGTILVKRRQEPLQSDHLVVTKIRRKVDMRPERKSRKVVFSYTNQPLKLEQDLCTLFLRVKKPVPPTNQPTNRADNAKRKDREYDAVETAVEPTAKRPKVTAAAQRAAPVARSIGIEVGELAEAQHAVNTFSDTHKAQLQYILSKGLHFDASRPRPHQPKRAPVRFQPSVPGLDDDDVEEVSM